MNPRLNEPVARARASIAIAAAAFALAACTSMGGGTGNVSTDGAPVVFAWTSKDGGNTGTMTAVIGGSTSYTGPFLQMTSTVRDDGLDPLWVGWQRGWGDWRYWGPMDYATFSTRYSGKVLANLKGPDTQRMRCRFHLSDPSSGMGGGGQGECQLGGGRVVDAVFTKS